MPSLASNLITTPTANADYMFTVYFIDATQNAVEITLPEIIADGQHFYFRNVSSPGTTNTVTIRIDSESDDTLENQPSLQLPNGISIHLVAFNNNWALISKSM